jgi:phosphatidylglycerol lysyltransferase
MNPRLKRWLKAAFTLALAAVMLLGVDRLLRTFDTDEVIAGFRAIPTGSIAAALGLLALLYLVYVVQELMAARFAGHGSLGAPRIAAASLVSRSLATLGMGTISGVALRLRIYGGWGLTPGDVARVSLYNELGYYVGIASSVAVVFTVTDVPAVATANVPLPGPLLGVAGALVVAAYVAVTLLRREPIRIRKFEIPVLRGELLLAQLALPLALLVVGGAIVWVCLPASAGLGLPETIAVAFLASLGGSASQVPGGLGVFETIVLQFVPPAAQASALAGLLVRRVIVNLVPIGLGAITLVVLEGLRRPARPPTAWTDATASALAVAVFASGVVLVIGASIGHAQGPFAALGPATHGVVFALGFAMLLVARGLHLRHAHAWQAAVVLVVLRVGVALLAGPDLPALLASLALLALLVAGRRVCREHRTEPEDPLAWWTSIGVALLGIGYVALTADPGSVTRGVIVRAAGVITAAAVLAGFAVARARRERVT